MRYKLEDILTFLTVIEAGGLTAAARRLGVAKSVASKRVEGSGAALLARDRELKKLQDLGRSWANNLGPVTNNRARTINICIFAKGLAELMPYFGIVGLAPFIGTATAWLKELGLNKVKLSLPWTRRGLRGEMFLNDLYKAPDPLE